MRLSSRSMATRPTSRKRTSMTTAINREAWITLALVPGVGPLRFQALLRAFETPDGALAAPFAFLCTVPGISRACATAVRDAARQRTGAQTLEALERLEARALLFNDALYPAQLREIPDPPMVLFVMGGATEPERLERLERLSTLSAAIVGTRHPSDYGITVTRMA